jgi:hypothetical protein
MKGHSMQNRLLAAIALACFLAPALVVAVIIVLLMAPQAFADTGSVSIVIPWGKWLAQALANVQSLAVAFVAAVVARWAPAYVKSLLTEQVVTRAVDYAFGAVAGAVQGKTLDVATTNALINAAANYAIANEPKIAAKLGDLLRPTILAKLSALGVVPADATAAQVGASVVPK